MSLAEYAEGRRLRKNWESDMSSKLDRTVFVEYFPLWRLMSTWTDDGKLEGYVLTGYEYD